MDLFPLKMYIIDMTYYNAHSMWIDIQRNKIFKIEVCFVGTHISTLFCKDLRTDLLCI